MRFDALPHVLSDRARMAAEGAGDRGSRIPQLAERAQGVSSFTVICRYMGAFVLLAEKGRIPVSQVTVLAGRRSGALSL
jgi:hypothetical protein